MSAAHPAKRGAIVAAILLIAAIGACFSWLESDPDVVPAKNARLEPLTEAQIPPDASASSAVTAVPHTYTLSVKTGTVLVRWEHLTPAQSSSAHQSVPSPSTNDAATGAAFSVVDGLLPVGRPNPLHCLNDGKMPVSSDDAEANFRFRIGTKEGRIKAVFSDSIRISQINSYSWHVGTRAPQLYSVYGSTGASTSFNPSPTVGVDPESCGWTKIADVDTRSSDQPSGGRYAVSITDDSGSLGTFRFLLFRMFPTDPHDDASQTFYSEIDVLK